MYIRLIFLTLLLFGFVGCANKANIDTIKSQDVSLSKLHKNIFLQVMNSSNEKINIEYDLKKSLEKQGYKIVKHKDLSSLVIKLNIVYAGIVDKKSGVESIMKDINVNIGIGGSSGNVSIYTKIGATLGRILGEQMDSTLFQTVVDIQLYEQNHDVKNTQLIITTPMNAMDKEEVIYHVEEEIVTQTRQIFP